MTLILLRTQQVMRISTLIFFMLACFTEMLAASPAVAQYLQQKVNVSFKNDNAWTAIQRLEELDIHFAYDARTLRLSEKKVADARFKDEPVAGVLRYILAGTMITYQELSPKYTH